RFIRLYINRDISKLKQVSESDVLAVSTHKLCSTCHGSGLNPQILETKINELNIADYNDLELKELQAELAKITDPIDQSIAKQAIPQLEQLNDLGLGYLRLSIQMGNLSGRIVK